MKKSLLMVKVGWLRVDVQLPTVLGRVQLDNNLPNSQETGAWHVRLNLKVQVVPYHILADVPPSAHCGRWTPRIPRNQPPPSRGQAFPQSSQPRFCPSQPIQGCEDSLDNGPTPCHFPPVGGSLVPFLSLKVQRVIDGEPQVPALLPWRKTLFLDGASLAILLTGYVLVAGVAAVVASPLQHLPLGTDHMVSPVLKASPWPPCWIPPWDGWEYRP